MGERGADRREHGEQETREESADRLELEKRRGEEDGVRLGEHVACPDVGQLVRDHRLDLGRGERRQEGRR